MTESRKAEADKAKDVKGLVEECIRGGMNFSDTQKHLKMQNIKYPNLSKTFYTWKAEIFPEEQRQKALTEIADKKKDKDKTTKPYTWNTKKQKDADESVFASVLNDALFYFVPCPQKNLTLEDVQKINLGGGIVATVTYYTDINLNHPIIVLVARAVMLVIKVKKMCYTISEKVSEAKQKARDMLPGQIGSMQ